MDYPFPVYVPAEITENSLAIAAPIRNRGKFPVLSYYDKLSKCAIWRSSQLVPTAYPSRSMDDEKLVAALTCALHPSQADSKQSEEN